MPSLFHLLTLSLCVLGTSTTASTIDSRSTVIDTIATRALPPTDGFNYVGCFNDGFLGHNIDYSIGSAADCISQCQQLGLRYCGLEYGTWCMGSNAVAVIPTSATGQCTTQCSDGSSTCGGGGYFDLYQTPATVTSCDYPEVLTKDSTGHAYCLAETLPSGSGYDFVGCYNDGFLGDQISYSVETAADCLSLCDQLGLRYCGLEYGAWCYGSNSVSVIPTSATGQCTTLCTDTTTFCGGSGVFDLYQNTPTETSCDYPEVLQADGSGHAFCLAVTLPSGAGFGHVGCFQDSFLGAQLSYSVETAADCLSLCQHGGYRYCGIEYGSWCYGSRAVSTLPYAATGCNTLCKDTSTFCGGSGVFDLYQNATTVTSCEFPEVLNTDHTGHSYCLAETLPSGSGFNHVACYQDGFLSQQLSYSVTTTADCLSLCHQAGLKYCGLEYGTWCWGGSVLSPTPIRATGCNTLCTDTTTFCGGSGVIDLYQLAATTSTTTIAKTTTRSSSSSSTIARTTTTSILSSSKSSTTTTTTRGSSSTLASSSKSSTTTSLQSSSSTISVKTTTVTTMRSTTASSKTSATGSPSKSSLSSSKLLSTSTTSKSTSTPTGTSSTTVRSLSSSTTSTTAKSRTTASFTTIPVTSSRSTTTQRSLSSTSAVSTCAAPTVTVYLTQTATQTVTVISYVATSSARR